MASKEDSIEDTAVAAPSITDGEKKNWEAQDLPFTALANKVSLVL